VQVSKPDAPNVMRLFKDFVPRECEYDTELDDKRLQVLMGDALCPEAFVLFELVDRVVERICPGLFSDEYRPASLPTNFIFSAPGGAAQAPHWDQELHPWTDKGRDAYVAWLNDDAAHQHALSVLITAENWASVLVAKHTHRTVIEAYNTGDVDVVRAGLDKAVVERVWIPPWSVLYFSNVLVHAGDRYDAEEGINARFHRYYPHVSHMDVGSKTAPLLGLGESNVKRLLGEFKRVAQLPKVRPCRGVGVT